MLSDRVQAWPTPLTGAGLFQNLHQIAAVVSATHTGVTYFLIKENTQLNKRFRKKKKNIYLLLVCSVEPAHEDEWKSPQVADMDTAYIMQKQNEGMHG